jgi:2-succinyl-6-hydroxy-2,4-cyclohexadiene-1-carboxylate synthase
MKACVAGIRSVMERTGAVRPAILGYSMGGRIALSLALHYPAEVSALVLESASPGVENQDERDVRRRADDNLAAKLEAEGISSFLDVWEQQPIFASQARLPERTRAEVRAERMRTSVVGAANALRELSQGRTAPLWEQLPLLTSRTLTIAGEDDEGYCDTTLRIAQTAPNCEAAIVARAGHNTHLEQPDLFVRAVIEFLERDESPERTHTHGTA